MIQWYIRIFLPSRRGWEKEKEKESTRSKEDEYMQCPVQDRKRNQKNPNLLCFVVWLAFVCVQFASLAKRLIACSNLTRSISYLTGFSFSTPSPSYYYHHHHHPTILVMWAFRFELYGSLVTHLGNFFFWIIFFRVFFGHANIFPRVLHCRSGLFFFFLFDMFFCFDLQGEAFLYVHFLFLGEGVLSLWITCSPV